MFISHHNALNASYSMPENKK